MSPRLLAGRLSPTRGRGLLAWALPGRVILEYLDPLNVLETEDVDWDRALRLGMLPGIYWGDEEAAEILGTYGEVYLREEIQAEAATRNLGGYARFLDTIALASGQWLNYRSEEHTSELQSQSNLVCRLLLEKKKPPNLNA